jgi:hypothetical protein
LPKLNRDAEITNTRDLKSLNFVVIENIDKMKRREAGYIEVTLFFADLVIGHKFTEVEKLNKLLV